jgi:DNA invertase Pin-like site-specific DNA recombinase
VIFGYARVSSSGQELYIQLEQLRASGCIRVFCEKQSGVKDERRELIRLLRAIRTGDVVIVTALDRLTRGGPYKMLCVLQEITSRGATYKSLAEPWADTTHELGELLAALVGYVARKTREDILRRTAEGRARAVARGVRMGRPPKLALNESKAALARKVAGEPLKAIARDYNVSLSTIARLRQPTRSSSFQAS